MSAQHLLMTEDKYNSCAFLYVYHFLNFDSGGILGCHYIRLLRFFVKLDIFLRLYLRKSGIICVPSGRHIYQSISWGLFATIQSDQIHTAIVFFTGRPIAHMSWIIFAALVGAAVLGVYWNGGFSSPKFPTMTGTVGIFPMVDGFRRCSSFLDLICNFHALKHVACLLVGISFKLTYDQVGLFSPAVGNGVEK